MTRKPTRYVLLYSIHIYVYCTATNYMLQHIIILSEKEKKTNECLQMFFVFCVFYDSSSVCFSLHFFVVNVSLSLVFFPSILRAKKIWPERGVHQPVTRPPRSLVFFCFCFFTVRPNLLRLLCLSFSAI